MNTQNNLVMVVGFLALVIGIATDGIRKFRRPVFPFVIFGLFMALAGLMAHKPLTPAVEHNEVAHQAHSALATLAGISITVGLLWQALHATTFRSRVIITTLAMLCFVLPLCMLAFQDVQGLIQRIMYLLVFAWLWLYFPGKIMTSKALQSDADKPRR